MIDWNGNGMLDPIDIGFSLAIMDEDSEEEIEDSDDDDEFKE